MVMYMFPCYSLHISPSSSPRPVPMSISLFSMFSQFFKVPFALNSQSWASQAALVVENLPANAGDIRDVGLIPGSGRSPGGGHGNPFQYSNLENPIERGAWQVTVHGVAKSRTRLKRLSSSIATSSSGTAPAILLPAYR